MYLSSEELSQIRQNRLSGRYRFVEYRRRSRREKTTFSFDWCPMRQGSGKIDPVNLIVIVQNGSNQQQFEIPTHGWESGHKLEWIKAEIDLAGITIDKNTKITIKQTQWPAKNSESLVPGQHQDHQGRINSGQLSSRQTAVDLHEQRRRPLLPLFPHSERCRRSTFAILSPEIFFLSLKNFLSLNSESYQGRAKKHRTS